VNAADWVAVAMAPVTVFGAVVATLAWRTADKSRHISDGVRQDQAEAETRRRWREMRPELDVTLERQEGSESRLLRVKLVGPRDVERYDWIRVQVRDDVERSWPGPGRGYTEEELRRQVWGPFWFRHGVEGGSEDHRTAEQGGKAVTDEWVFVLDLALAPHWYSGGDPQWRKDYNGKPIRLRIDIGLGDQTWTEHREVPTPRAVSRRASVAE
jgi:hypothetical protein